MQGLESKTLEELESLIDWANSEIKNAEYFDSLSQVREHRDLWTKQKVAAEKEIQKRKGK